MRLEHRRLKGVVSQLAVSKMQLMLTILGTFVVHETACQAAVQNHYKCTKMHNFEYKISKCYRG